MKHRRHCAPRPWHKRLRHSLRWRLVTLFLLLAVCTSFVFIGGTTGSTADTGFPINSSTRIGNSDFFG